MLDSRTNQTRLLQERQSFEDAAQRMNHCLSAVHGAATLCWAQSVAAMHEPPGVHTRGHTARRFQSITMTLHSKADSGMDGPALMQRTFSAPLDTDGGVQAVLALGRESLQSGGGDRGLRDVAVSLLAAAPREHVRAPSAGLQHTAPWQDPAALALVADMHARTGDLSLDVEGGGMCLRLARRVEGKGGALESTCVYELRPDGMLPQVDDADFLRVASTTADVPLRRGWSGARDVRWAQVLDRVVLLLAGMFGKARVAAAVVRSMQVFRPDPNWVGTLCVVSLQEEPAVEYAVAHSLAFPCDPPPLLRAGFGRQPMPPQPSTRAAKGQQGPAPPVQRGSRSAKAPLQADAVQARAGSRGAMTLLHVDAVQGHAGAPLWPRDTVHPRPAGRAQGTCLAGARQARISAFSQHALTRREACIALSAAGLSGGGGIAQRLCALRDEHVHAFSTRGQPPQGGGPRLGQSLGDVCQRVMEEDFVPIKGAFEMPQW